MKPLKKILCNRKLLNKIFTISVLVFITLILKSLYQQNLIPTSSGLSCMNKTKNIAEMQEKLEIIKNEVEMMKLEIQKETEKTDELKRKNNKLDMLIKRMEEKVRVERSKPMEPTNKYETHRRRLIKNVQVMWDYFKERTEKMDENVKKLAGYNLRYLLDSVYQHKLLLLSDLEIMTKNDGYDTWRQRELQELENIFRKTFEELQYPSDCDNRKKLTCHSETTDCGWGCQVHHIIECFTMALGLERTFFYNSIYFNYGEKNFEKVVEPFVSNNCSVDFTSAVQWLNAKGNESVIYFPFSFHAYDLHPRPKFLPSAVPTSIAKRLIKINSHPISWWLGWIYEVAIKMTPLARENFQKVSENLKFENPIVGVHIRRTDKLDQGEANFHSIEEYMDPVDGYYDQLELTEKDVKRRLYLATEDPEVLQELQSKYPNYQVISNFEATKETNKSRWTLESLVGVMTDIELLVSCDFVVCTFSSNVCRMVLERMQTKFLDATNRVKSIDWLYHNYGQNQEFGRIVHESKNTRLLRVQRGDIVRVYYHQIFAAHFTAQNVNTNVTSWMSDFEIERIPEEIDFPYFS